MPHISFRMERVTISGVLRSERTTSKRNNTVRRGSNSPHWDQITGARIIGEALHDGHSLYDCAKCDTEDRPHQRAHLSSTITGIQRPVTEARGYNPRSQHRSRTSIDATTVTELSWISPTPVVAECLRVQCRAGAGRTDSR